MDGISNYQILGEIRALAGMFTGMARQIDRIESRLTDVESHLFAVESRLTDVESRLANVENRLTGVESRLTDVENRLFNVEKQTALIPGIVEALTAFSDDIDHHEKRLRKLESLRV